MKPYKQLSFSEKIKWRNRALGCLLVLMLIYMVVVGEMDLGDSRMMTPLAQRVSRIIVFGGMIWVGWKMHQNRKLLADRVRLLEQMMHEQDERNRYLHDKSGGVVWDVLFVCMLFVTLTASLVDMPAFYTALTLLALAVLLKITAYSFYKRRG